MSKINEYAKNITPSLYEKLKTAVETGKWIDGAPLTETQKADSLQLVMAYQNEYNDQPDHFTISQRGDIYMEDKKVLKKRFADEASTSDVHLLKL